MTTPVTHLTFRVLEQVHHDGVSLRTSMKSGPSLDFLFQGLAALLGRPS